MTRLDFFNSLTQEQVAFLKSFEYMQESVYKTNTLKGFHKTDDAIDTLTEKYGVPAELVAEIHKARVSQKIALTHSELSEGLEAVRKSKTADEHIPEFSGLEAELADAVIRIMNLATREKAGLAEAILAKAAYNETRAYQHGGKAF